MASRYEKIKTAKELMTDIQIHGRFTSIEDTIAIQDILGKSTVDELVDLANDIGRNNEFGQPDPNGTWGGNRNGTRDVFYSTLFAVWSWEDATRFWNLHSNIAMKMADERNAELVEEKKEADEEVETLKKQVALLEGDCDSYEDTINRLNHENQVLVGKLTDSQSDLGKAQDEILRLKAKLYDMMVAMNEKEAK